MIQLVERPSVTAAGNAREILTPKQEKARARHEQAVNTEGRILPKSHEFSATLNRVAQKLGLPSSDVDVLAVDTEEPNAYYALDSKVIVATRGLFRDIQSKFESNEFRTQFNYPENFHFSEDHIAAVLAHELEHARVLGDAYVEQLSLSWKDRLLSMFSHAEEYRADAEAVRHRLADAGYNPRALIDVLRAFGLTTGRDDIAHPEIIDRVGKLELELADDKRPIANATKPLQELPESLIEWFNADSDVYQQTEALIHATPQELREQLGKASSQKEFWRTYVSLEHAERIVTAQAFVEQNRKSLIQLVKNHMIVNILVKNGKIGNGFTNPEAHLTDDSNIVRLITQHFTRTSGPNTVYMPSDSSLLTTEEARSTLLGRMRELNQLLAEGDFAEWQ